MEGEISSDLMMQNLAQKRKRSPRQRPWNSSSSDDDIVDGKPTLRSSSKEEDDDDKEEHQAAKCLMLLSLSKYQTEFGVSTPRKSWSEKKINGGLYQCKTCNRTFQSFQALGGHRTSHRKMKMKSEEILPQKQTEQLIVPIALHIETSRTHRKVRIHKCLICNAVFASGQALGGHMRRHRVTVSEGQTSDRIETKSDCVTLSLLSPALEETGNEASRSNNDFQCLDLNFPVTSDDEIGESQFCFGSNRPEQRQVDDSGMVFSSSALVNCHY